MTKHSALMIGLFCHFLFVVAVLLMAWELYVGMQSGLGTLHDNAARFTDMLLVIQFPVIHSFLLTKSGQRWLRRMIPGPSSIIMTTTSFAICAALQVIVVFMFWSPTGVVLWQATGPWQWMLTFCYALSWLYLAKSMVDAGLGVQTGYLGWLSVYRGAPPRFPTFSTTGCFRHSRQPMYLAYTLILWTPPCITPDRLFLATIWTLYCYFGPRLKEQRYLERYGESFRQYQSTVRYWLPLPAKARSL